jgi:hypothetical protein
VVTAAAAVLLLPGCAAGQLQFRQQHRVVIDSPRDRELTGLPLTVTWRVVDPALARAAPRFAVFVDRPPVPAGEALSWVARDDRQCVAPCPDAAYLSQHDVYPVDGTSLTLASLRALDQTGRNEVHDITIVLLGADGRRAGEEAYRVQVRVPRRD